MAQCCRLTTPPSGCLSFLYPWILFLIHSYHTVFLFLFREAAMQLFISDSNQTIITSAVQDPKAFVKLGNHEDNLINCNLIIELFLSSGKLILEALSYFYCCISVFIFQSTSAGLFLTFKPIKLLFSRKHILIPKPMSLHACNSQMDQEPINVPLEHLQT